jgi:hypothetical protein
MDPDVNFTHPTFGIFTANLVPSAEFGDQSLFINVRHEPAFDVLHR